MQPIALDEHGTARFQSNAVICRLLAESQRRGFGLNELFLAGEFPQADVDQFYQLIGYSVGGYGDLSLVSRESVAQADEVVERLMAEE